MMTRFHLIMILTHSLRDDADNYVPPPIQKNDMMLSVIEQMKSQVEKCNKETLILAEESQLKMLEKQTVVNTKPIDDSKLNKLYEIFVPQTQLFAEQLYWSSILSPLGTVSKPKVFPKKLPSTSQISENNKLRAQLKGKLFESQMHHNGTSVNTKLSKPSTSETKLYSVTPFPKSKELLEEARALKPLDEHIGNASKFAEQILELLVYVSTPCPFTQSGNEKWAPATSHKKNNKPYVDASRTKQTIETITKEHAIKQNTCKIDNTMLAYTGRVSSTNASGLKPKSNTKNDRIPQPSNRSMKNKVEAQHRKFKSSANKNNHVSDCNVNVKNIALSKNSDIICLSCNECLKWILTGRTFNLVGKLCPPSYSNDTSAIVVPPGHILTTTVMLVDVPCLKLRPDLHGLTSGHISSGLVLNQAASTSAKPPIKNDWDLLFQPMFDEYFKNLSATSNPIFVATLPPLDTVGRLLLLLLL
ncbi:hypothetical protein Tco_0648225 [Tanacetum coccineum]